MTDETCGFYLTLGVETSGRPGGGDCSRQPHNHEAVRRLLIDNVALNDVENVRTCPRVATGYA